MRNPSANQLTSEQIAAIILFVALSLCILLIGSVRVDPDEYQPIYPAHLTRQEDRAAATQWQARREAIFSDGLRRDAAKQYLQGIEDDKSTR